MLKSKKLIAVVAILFLIMGISVQVMATSGDPMDIPLLTNSDESANAVVANEMMANALVANQIAANQIASNSTGTNSQIIQPTTNSTGNSYSGNSLPQTGVTEDITVMFFIVVCVISSVYAYKKIKDYNLK